MRVIVGLVILTGGLIFTIMFIVAGIPVLERVVQRTAPAPQQPINFSHIVHATGQQIDCLFCHRGANTGAVATVPAVEQCMFCHKAIVGAGGGNPEIEKVRATFAENKPIEWVRVHRMPDHVHFVHEAHVNRGFACATCHGNVGAMAQVSQVRALNMGDCIACHRANNGPTDCGKCHY